MSARVGELEAKISRLLAVFGPLMDEADWHVEGCDCAGCKWFEKASEAALRAIEEEP